jgi:hypothetical protein
MSIALLSDKGYDSDDIRRDLIGRWMKKQSTRVRHICASTSTCSPKGSWNLGH